MRRVVIRFKDGTATSFDLFEERLERDLLHHLGLFPGKEVERVEEQVHDPAHPRRFRYTRREDLEALCLSYTRGASGESV
jgi:hypothetical protein